MTGEDINGLVEQQSKTDARVDSLAEEDINHHNLALAIIQDLAYSHYTKEEVDKLLANIQGGGSDSWTIGDDGYWYKNGEKTDYRAIGMDGRDGADADMSAYYTKDEVLDLINACLSEYAKKEELQYKIDLHGAMLQELDNKIAQLQVFVAVLQKQIADLENK